MGSDQVGAFCWNHFPCFLEASSQPNKHAYELATGFKGLFICRRLKSEMNHTTWPPRWQQFKPGGQACSQVSAAQQDPCWICPGFKRFPTADSLPSSAHPRTAAVKIATGTAEAAYEILHIWIPTNVF